MHKQRNNDMSKRGATVKFRAGLLAAAAAVTVMTATPTPAHALFGGITKAIGGLFGGGDEGGGGGCGGGEGLLDSFTKAGVRIATGDVLGAGVAVGSAAKEAGEEFVGCPVIESIPGAVEIQAIKTAVEAVIQTAQAIEQTKHQANMLAHAKFSLVDWLLDNWEEFLALLGGESEAITWEEPAVRDEFETAYPENPVFETPDDLGLLRQQQDELGRAASIDSKRVSAKLAGDIEELSGQLEALEAERHACAGQTCVGDINVQIGMVSAQLQAKTALMQAAHNRVAESPIDAEREAKRAADAEWNRVMQGVDTYSGGAGM